MLERQRRYRFDELGIDSFTASQTGLRRQFDGRGGKRIIAGGKRRELRFCLFSLPELEVKTCADQTCTPTVSIWLVRQRPGNCPCSVKRPDLYEPIRKPCAQG